MRQFICPKCENEVLILIISGNAQLRMPIKKGFTKPAKEVCLEIRASGVNCFSFSDEKDTRITFYPDEGLSYQLHCTKCNEAFDLPGELECSDAE